MPMRNNRFTGMASTFARFCPNPESVRMIGGWVDMIVDATLYSDQQKWA